MNIQGKTVNFTLTVTVFLMIQMISSCASEDGINSVFSSASSDDLTGCWRAITAKTTSEPDRFVKRSDTYYDIYHPGGDLSKLEIEKNDEVSLTYQYNRGSSPRTYRGKIKNAQLLELWGDGGIYSKVNCATSSTSSTLPSSALPSPSTSGNNVIPQKKFSPQTDEGIYYTAVLPGKQTSDFMFITSDGKHSKKIIEDIPNSARFTKDKKMYAYYKLNWDIHTSNADGTEDKNITNTSDLEEYFPYWSPDERQIVYVAKQTGKDSSEQIYLMNSDGSDAKQLTTDSSNNEPIWLPDGSGIVFLSSRDRKSIFDGYKEIYVMNTSGSTQKRITQTNSTVLSFKLSPDGKTIIYQKNIDPEEIPNLTSGGRTYATYSRPVYMIKIDGTENHELVANSAIGRLPKISPDGKKILYVKVEQHTPNTSPDAYILTVVNLDGTNSYNIQSSKYPQFFLWSPDGKKIAFTSPDQSENFLTSEIFVINADGTEKKQLTNNGLFKDLREWR